MYFKRVFAKKNHLESRGTVIYLCVLEGPQAIPGHSRRREDGGRNSISRAARKLNLTRVACAREGAFREGGAGIVEQTPSARQMR